MGYQACNILKAKYTAEPVLPLIRVKKTGMRNLRSQVGKNSNLRSRKQMKVQKGIQLRRVRSFTRPWSLKHSLQLPCSSGERPDVAGHRLHRTAPAGAALHAQVWAAAKRWR